MWATSPPCRGRGRGPRYSPGAGCRLRGACSCSPAGGRGGRPLGATVAFGEARGSRDAARHHWRVRGPRCTAAAVAFCPDVEGAQGRDAGGRGAIVAAADAAQGGGFSRAGARPGVAVAKPGQLEEVLDRGPPSLGPRLLMSSTSRGWIDGEARWVPVEAGRWRQADQVVLGEGRAALKALARLAVVPEARRSKVFSLEDTVASRAPPRRVGLRWGRSITS